MKPYSVQLRFIDDGNTHEPGTVAEFSDLRAEQLKAFGFILDVPEAAFELTSSSEPEPENPEAEEQPKRTKKGK